MGNGSQCSSLDLFCGTIWKIQYVGRIIIKNTGGVDQVRHNGDLSYGFGKKTNKEGNIAHQNNKVEIFHEVSEEMAVVLSTMDKEDWNATCIIGHTNISK